MVKNLLLASAVALAAFCPINAQAADQITELSWHYGAVPSGFNRLGTSTTYTDYAFIYVDATTATRLAGCQVNAIKFINGVFKESSPKMTVYLTESISSTPIFTQEDVSIDKSTANLNMTTVRTWKSTEVELNSPYTIKAGQGFYVGFSYTEKATNNYPLTYDNIASDKYQGFLVARVENGTELKNIKLEDKTSTYGSLGIQLNISGNSIPQYDAAIASIATTDAIVSPGTRYKGTVTFFNAGAQPISNITYNVSNDNGEAQSATYTPSSALAFGESATFDVNFKSDNACMSEGKVEIVSVNDTTDENSADNSGSCQMIIWNEYGSQGYKRNVLGEEFTGTWCGWCPRGYVGMEYMKDKYTDGSWIGVAEHYGDEMQDSSFSDRLSTVSGYPSAIIDRLSTWAVDPESSYLESGYTAQRRKVSPATISKLTAMHSTTTVYVTAEATFAFDVAPGSWNIEYILREDNVGPYDQTNYYAGGSYGTMGGFESMSSPVSLKFNDVGRTRVVIENAFPNGAKANSAVSHSASFQIPDGVNIDNTNVVAVLVSASGFLANAATTQDYAGVNDIMVDQDAQFTPSVNNGVLTVGNVAAQVYSLSGQRVATIAPNASAALAPGLYIVRAANRAVKVLVR